MSSSLQNTVGPLLAGAMFSAACVVPCMNDLSLFGLRSLSGVLAVQIFFYHHTYPKDHRLYKVMVGNIIDLSCNHLDSMISIMSH
jgi:hypothetical protein